MAATLYEPPKKTLVPRWLVAALLIIAAIALIGGYAYRRHPGWLVGAASGILGLIGYELISIDVATTPTRADILLDGERATELPLHVRRDSASHRISAIAPGFEPAEVTFKADGDRQIFLTLKPAKQR
jgi:hypothetical protein